MNYFVYLTTNLIDNKKYVGNHSSEVLEDGYLGSGIIIKKAIRKYGKNNFRRDILERFTSNLAAFNGQKKYIDDYNTLYPNGYNLSPMGGVGCPGSLSEISLSKMRSGVSKSNKGKISHRKGKNLSKEHCSNISKGIMGEHNPNFGGLSESLKEKISLNHADVSGEKNGMFGKKHSKEAINSNRQKHLKENLPIERLNQMKLSATKKPRIICKYCNQSVTTAMHTRWHGNKCKNKNTINE